MATPTRTPTRILPAMSALIVREDGHVLLERRSDNGRWGLPGGAVEIGESILDATRREVEEETGLQVEIVRLVGLYSDPATQVVSYPDGNVVHYVSANFECRVAGGTLRTTEENTGFRWWDPDTPLPQPFVPSQEVRIHDWREGTGAPYVR